MVFSLLSSWQAFLLLAALSAAGLLVGASLAAAAVALVGRGAKASVAAARSDNAPARGWLNRLLAPAGVLAMLASVGVLAGVWPLAHSAVWDNSVPGRAAARSGHWEQRVEEARGWAGRPAYAERVEKARSDGARSTAEPRIAVRCSAGEGLSVLVAPGDARFGAVAALAVVGDARPVGPAGRSRPARLSRGRHRLVGRPGEHGPRGGGLRVRRRLGRRAGDPRREAAGRGAQPG